MTRFDFAGLYVFEIANNHQGSVDHGRRIVRDIADVVRENGIRGAVKLQMRDLDTFIHPAHRSDSSNGHIRRFLETRLTLDGYRALLGEIRACGLVAMCTPFDEPSVDRIVELGFDVLKVGSPSAADWPLIEAVADAGLPVVFSTGGLTLKQIDDVVSLFSHRRVDFAVMHCVSIYPTPPDLLQLEQIAVLRERYPGTPIGFSTHEDPDSLVPVQVAIAKGAQLLERHVGARAEGVTLNAYSSEKAQLDRWVKASLAARIVSGTRERPPASDAEVTALRALKRGAFARRAIKAGSELERADVYFAMPWQEGTLGADGWRERIFATAAIAKDAPIGLDAVRMPAQAETQVLYTAIHEIKGMLNEARVPLNTEFMAEFSHHYGIGEFRRYGATIIECVNRGYCKKLLILLPGQRHPNHYHKKKEETFQVLHGVLEIEVEGRRRTLQPGDSALVQQGVWHEFWSDAGAIVEEISSTHFNEDSYYEDKAINRVDRSQRKTLVNNWGRYQI